MKRPLSIILTLSLLTLSSCSNFIKFIEGDDAYLKVDKKSGSDHFSILTSGNINGETHPCGCRQFPLGGIPQVAGQLAKYKKLKPFIYVDAGDTFFPSPQMPDSMQESLKFTAHHIAKSFDQLGLKFFVPGDQDFAAGTEFLNQISKQYKFDFLLANLKNPNALKHIKWSKIKLPEKEIYFTGVVKPSLFLDKHRGLFLEPMSAVKRVIDEMVIAGYEPENKNHKLVIISHGGGSFDLELAKKFPQTTWVIGAHTQNFNKFPIKEGKTQLTQVLSRNHYLGEIQFFFGKDNHKTEYDILEMRDELAKELKPNKFSAQLLTYKTALQKIQAKEESALKVFHADTSILTSSSCVDCHEAQTEKWHKTAHATSFYSLIQAQEQKNQNCIGCHSVGHTDPKGYTKSSKIILIEGEKKADPDDKFAALKKRYWAEIGKKMHKVRSVRDLSEGDKQKYAQVWAEVDSKFNVSENYANVQCLNCHEKTSEHPFNGVKSPLSATAKLENMKNKCLNCHTTDQSPAWYHKDDKGLPSSINESVVIQRIREIACPKME